MTTAKERMLQIPDKLGISRRQFQRTIGVSPTYIVNMVERPTQKVINKIKSRYPQINTDWILTGNGEMLLPGMTLTNSNTFHKVKNNNEGHAEHVGDNVDTKAAELVQSQNEIINKILEQSAKKDEQIDRLLALLEKNMKDGSN